MNQVITLKRKPKFRIVGEDERVFGSPEFIALGRNPALRSPVRFEPTVKQKGDVVI